MNQNWILDPNKRYQVISDFNKEIAVTLFRRLSTFVLGDGIETNSKDFKEEVASQLTQKS